MLFCLIQKCQSAKGGPGAVDKYDQYVIRGQAFDQIALTAHQAPLHKNFSNVP